MIIKAISTLFKSPSLFKKFCRETWHNGFGSAKEKVRMRLAVSEPSPGSPPFAVDHPEYSETLLMTSAAGIDDCVPVDPDRFVVLSHDATRTGAPLLALHIAKTLKETFGKKVIILLLDGGFLESDFKKYGQVINLELAQAGEDRFSRIERALATIRNMGAAKCISNTVVSGNLQQPLQHHGFEVVNLIHELPGSIQYYHLTDAAREVASFATKIIFSAAYVRDAFTRAFTIEKAEVIVRPQGLYTKNPFTGERNKARNYVRGHLDLDSQDTIVLGCGFADTRKGLDLFIGVAYALIVKRGIKDVHFLWLGDVHPDVRLWADNDLQKAGIDAYVHFVDYTRKAPRFFAGSDFFLLTSREDPLPTVMLEAMDAGVPVISFDKAGGAPEVIGQDCGILVPFLDVAAMAEEIIRLKQDPDRYREIAKNAKTMVDEGFTHESYVKFLIGSFKQMKFDDPSVPDSKYFCCLFDGITTTCTKNPDYVPLSETPAPASDVKIIAFYLPQFHPFPENDQWWGKGFTEWTNVTRAVPQFIGHYQPHLPGELGFYDLRVPEILVRQVELAAHHGIYGFCFHYYWFGGKRLMEKPVLQFLENKDIDFNFCFCWANENWTRTWDGEADSILIAQDHSPEDDINFIKHMEKYFKDRRYIRIDNRPVLVVYRPNLLPEPKATAERWRNYCKKQGIGDLYLIATHSFDYINPGALGFDASMEFSPNNMHPRHCTGLEFVNPRYAGNVFDYNKLVEDSYLYQPPPYKKFRTVCPSWDNEPRRPGCGNTFHHACPELYGEWLETVCHFTDRNFKQNEKLVFINAWNEWAEGCHLEPDRKFGYGYLEATSRVMKKFSSSRNELVRSTHLSLDRKAQIGVIVHLYYLDLWDELKGFLENITHPFDLYISLNPACDQSLVETIIKAFPQVRLFIFENRGRDIWPFLCVMEKIKGLGYEYLCKIHTKKSVHIDHGDEWRANLLNELMGTRERVDRVLDYLDQNPDTGMVVPQNYILPYHICVGLNEETATINDSYVRRFAAKLDIGIDETTCFPTGSMFWFRPEALLPMLGLGIRLEDFPPEHGQVDGTLHHALERVFILSVTSAGLAYCDTAAVAGCDIKN